MAESRARGRGEGSIRERPDGRWEARYRDGVDESTGKYVRKSVYGATKAEVVQKLAALHLLVVDRKAARGTIAELLDRWLEGKIRPNRARATYVLYDTVARKWIAPYIGDRQVSRIGVLIAGLDLLRMAFKLTIGGEGMNLAKKIHLWWLQNQETFGYTIGFAFGRISRMIIDAVKSMFGAAGAAISYVQSHWTELFYDPAGLSSDMDAAVANYEKARPGSSYLRGRNEGLDAG